MNVVLYARVSSTEQAEGFSIPSQLKLLRGYAATHSFKIIREFQEAETAKRAGRTEFKKMCLFVEESKVKIDAILVEKTDRLYRNFHDYVLLNYEELNISIHLVKEGEILSKTSKSHQKFIHGIKVLMAKNYIDNLSEEVHKGLNEKMDQGHYPSYAPMGYKNNLKTHMIEVNETEAPLVRKLFETASTGNYSIRELCRTVYSWGLLSRRSRTKLSKASLDRMLKNEIYWGWIEWGDRKFLGKHEPLISKELFDLVQLRMGYRSKPIQTKRNFAFTGLIKCECGCLLTAEYKRKKSGREYIYYRCTNHKEVHDSVTYFKEEDVDKVFSDAIKAIQIPSEIVEYTRKALLDSHKDEIEFHRNATQKLQLRREKLQSYIEKAYEDKLEGVIDISTWEKKTGEWRKEQEDIVAHITHHDRADYSYLNEGIKLLELANHAYELYVSQDNTEKRKLLGLILWNPKVVNGSIEYSYKKPFDMLTNVTEIEKWRERRA